MVDDDFFTGSGVKGRLIDKKGYWPCCLVDLLRYAHGSILILKISRWE